MERLSRGPPIEHLQLDEAPAVVFVDLGREGQIETASRQSFIAGAPPDTILGCRTVSNPQLHVPLLHPHALRRALQGQVRRKEMDRRIAYSHRLQLIERVQAVQIHVRETHLRIEAQRGL